jgi:hypothetical protein
MYPSVIRSAMHAAARCALAITALLLGINLRNITFEEENKRGSLHSGHIISVAKQFEQARRGAAHFSAHWPEAYGTFMAHLTLG